MGFIREGGVFSKRRFLSWGLVGFRSEVVGVEGGVWRRFGGRVGSRFWVGFVGWGIDLLKY